MKISEIINVTRTWRKQKQVQFCENVLLTIPLSIRGILSENAKTDKSKLEVIKWLNELTHRVQHLILEFNSGSKNDIIQQVEQNVKQYAKENPDAKPELYGIIRFAYEKTELNSQ
jgi:hypothetical protein